MKLYDTHCHFETDDASTIAAILRRAKAAGVEKLMAVGGSVALNASAMVAANLADAVDLPKTCAALGYERDQIDASRPAIVAQPVAWGEIGLDYHY